LPALQFTANNVNKEMSDKNIWVILLMSRPKLAFAGETTGGKTNADC